MELIEFKGKQYPALQGQGYASQYAYPFAVKFCKGNGMDIGCCKLRWAFPGSMPIDAALPDEWDAMNLPDHKEGWDYIFSSHMLEHYIGRFQDPLEYWLSKINSSGIIFLYLPNCEVQEYWAWGNKKHAHYLTPDILKRYCRFMRSEGLIKDFMVTDGWDLNASFYCIIEKI